MERAGEKDGKRGWMRRRQVEIEINAEKRKANEGGRICRKTFEHFNITGRRTDIVYVEKYGNYHTAGDALQLLHRRVALVMGAI